MKARALGRVFELPVRDVQADGPPQLVDAVNALLFGVSLVVPPTRVPTPTPIELACRAAAESQRIDTDSAAADRVAGPGAASTFAPAGAREPAAIELAPHTSFAVRALESGAANDGTKGTPAERRRRPSEGHVGGGPSAGDVEAMVRLAAARSAAPALTHTTATQPTSAAPSAAEAAPPQAPRVVVPTLIATHTADVEFGAGGADARIEIAHPELGPIRLELTFSAGGVALRALTPSTTAALALRALEPAVARALAARGIAFRSLRVDVASDSRATVSRSERRRTDLEEEA